MIYLLILLLQKVFENYDEEVDESKPVFSDSDLDPQGNHKYFIVLLFVL